MEQIEIIGLDKEEKETSEDYGSFYFPIFFIYNININNVSKFTKLYIEVQGDIINKIKINDYSLLALIEGTLRIRIQYLNDKEQLFIENINKKFFEEIDISKIINKIGLTSEIIPSLSVTNIFISKITSKSIYFAASIKAIVEGL